MSAAAHSIGQKGKRNVCAHTFFDNVDDVVVRQKKNDEMMVLEHIV